jgi:YD repeat-containing protein
MGIFHARCHATQYRSDGFGRLREVLQMAGNCGQWGYTCSGGFTTSYAEESRTIYGYDALDRLTNVTGALGRSTTISYDTLGRKLSMNDADMGAWAYSYYPYDALKDQTDAKGQWGYNSADDLTSLTYPDGEVVSYGYDIAGRQLNLTSSTGGAIRLRMQVTGTNPTTIKLRAWADGTSEPST